MRDTGKFIAAAISFGALVAMIMILGTHSAIIYPTDYVQDNAALIDWADEQSAIMENDMPEYNYTFE